MDNFTSIPEAILETFFMHYTFHTIFCTPKFLIIMTLITILWLRLYFWALITDQGRRAFDEMKTILAEEAEEERRWLEEKDVVVLGEQEMAMCGCVGCVTVGVGLGAS
jgi:hypothetical protein